MNVEIIKMKNFSVLNYQMVIALMNQQINAWSKSRTTIVGTRKQIYVKIINYIKNSVSLQILKNSAIL